MSAPPVRLLYVEADADQRLLGRLALERLGGHAVTVAGSDDDLPALAQRAGCELILLAAPADPRATDAALARLRADARTAALPIVLMAAGAAPADAGRWRRLGALDVITDRPAPSALPARVRALWAAHHAPAAAAADASLTADDPMADLRRDFAAQIEARRARLHACRAAAAAGEAGAADELRQIAHRLAGTGATFGYAGLGRAAAAVERALLAWRAAPDATTAAALDDALAQFDTCAVTDRADAAGAAAAPAPAAPAAAPPPVGPAPAPSPAPAPAATGAGAARPADTSATADAGATALWTVGIAPALHATLPPFGERLHRFDDVDAALAALDAGAAPPAAVLIGTAMLGRQPAVASLRARAPLALFSGRGSFADRIAGVRAGAEACFAARVDNLALAEWLDARSTPPVDAALRVLLVDDDPMFIALCSHVLGAAGFAVRALDTPYPLPETLADFEPDLLLLDLYLRDCTGLEVATALRQQAAYARLPIVFLSADQDVAQQAAALGAGLDDWLVKPFEAARLRHVVRTRALRGRRLRAQIDTDALTGVLSARAFRLRLTAEVARAHRHDRPLTLARLDPDGLGAVNEEYGRPAGDRLLCTLAQQLGRRLRRSDLIGRSDGAGFAIALTETGSDVAACVVGTLRSAWARDAATATNLPGLSEPFSLSVGLTALRAGENAAALYARAARALHGAQAGAGRDRFVRTPDAGD